MNDPLNSVIQSMNKPTIFNFQNQADLSHWHIVDDLVMGGRSNGSIGISPEGHGIYSGEISTENNGGFSSVRYEFEPISVDANDVIQIRLKGDGNLYQFRIKHRVIDKASYKASFETTGKWQNIEIRLGDLYPTFRGRKLDRPNFDHDSIEEIRFLFSCKKPVTFELLIDSINLIKA